MYFKPSVAALAVCALASADGAAAWGVAGHQIVATIAQTLQAIRTVLPPWANGQLAAVASWPDRVRYQYPWSGQLHYATPIDPEHPPEDCTWEAKFKNDNNVITAIHNYTARVALDRDDIDLRFLIHYIGDVHQPLHLTGRERGGNGDPIIFERRHMSMHGLWDTALLTKSIREIRNYTRPLPSKQIEAALTGSIYDPYVRWIIWEGIRKWWIDSLPDWLDCGASSSPSSQLSSQTIFSSPDLSTTLSQIACPLTWAPEVHSYCCSHVFPPKYNMTAPPLELNTKEYHGKIVDDKVVEKLLAMGGLRLAGVLNALFADEQEVRSLGLIKDWRMEVEMPYVEGRKGWRMW